MNEMDPFPPIDGAADDAHLPSRAGIDAAPGLPGNLLAAFGTVAHEGLVSIRESLATLAPWPAASAEQLEGAMQQLDRLTGLCLQCSTAAGLMAGAALFELQQVDLADAVRRAAARRGRDWTGSITSTEPCTLEINRQLLDALLDLALTFMGHGGAGSTATIGLQGRPLRPALVLRTSTGPASSNPVEANLTALRWLLLSQLAQSAGLQARRTAMGSSLTVMLGFPTEATVAAPAKATAAGLPRTASPVGWHVLLIEPRDATRIEAHRLMREAGLAVDATESLLQAQEALRSSGGTVPDIVVSGMPFDDLPRRALLDSARAAQPRLRIVELVDDDDAFDFSVPGSDHPARVARHELARTLVPAIMQELDAAWR